MTVTLFQNYTIFVSEMSFYDSDEFTITMDEGNGDPEDLDSSEGDEGDGLEVIADGNRMVEVEPENDRSDAEEMGTDSETEDDNNNLAGLEMPKRKKKVPAAVWKLADRVVGGAKCKLCEKTFKCTQGNTTNIIGHMQSKHRDKAEVQLLINEQKTKREKLKLKRLQKEKKLSNCRKQPLITNFSIRRGIMDPLKKKKLDAALVKMTICMNRPFDDVENHHFHNVLFIAEPNYIVPSRRRHTANFDNEATTVEEDLKKDITKDVTEAGHKTINITSDHGTSADQFRTKKNALTVARCDDNFMIKKDIVKMIVCEGSQTGQHIREDVKKWLVQGAGWKPDWTVNWVTDNEAKQVNARLPGKHPGVGLPTTYTGFIEQL
jgi:hypothetical protein